VRRLLTYDPPLWVMATLLLAVTVSVSYAMTGALSPLALVMAGAGFGGHLNRRRRLARAAARGDVGRAVSG